MTENQGSQFDHSARAMVKTTLRAQAKLHDLLTDQRHSMEGCNGEMLIVVARRK